MKSQPKHISWVVGQGLVIALASVSVCGCASVDSTNTDTRAWGRASGHEQRDEEWRGMGWPLQFFNWPTVEQQRNEEWLRSH
jgi:hypothetical protein